jgi:molybdopterin/thiamine biosynthesis adenylyltransferase
MTGERYSRQSFLGHQAQGIIGTCVVGVVGLGGGGSHIVQQLAHLGFQNYLLFDPDVVEESNLNRLIGGTVGDAKNRQLKIEVARRLILGLQPGADIEAYSRRWQDEAEALRRCDLIFGCVDGFRERLELEISSRRYLIPFIDIGLDVNQVGDEAPVMAGQVILSMPGAPCMQCMKFITDDNLSEEGRRYGDAGSHPQVVWANGVLASTAVGICTDLLTDWTKAFKAPIYLLYTSNDGYIRPHLYLDFTNQNCTHYPIDQLGNPII